MRENEQIRMAYLVSQYPAVNHTFILREIRRLRALGFELHVASVRAADRRPEQMTAEEREEAAQVFYIKPQGVARTLAAQLSALAARPRAYLGGLVYALRLGGFSPRHTLSLLFYFAEAVVFGRWMTAHKLAHFHTHFSSTVGLFVRRVFPVTMSVTMHGPGEFSDPVAFHLTEKVRASAFLCAISSYARAQLMRVSDYREWGKIEVSPLGVDPAVFAPRPFRESPRPFEVICVGRLDPVKAQHVLVAAVDLLVRGGRDVRLRLVGDGPDRAGLERDVADRDLSAHVTFEGWLNQDAVRELYRGADAFALASFAEGVPVVLMEAMAMEIPCVATRITGVPELIRDGVDGLLVAPSDAEGLAAALARLMDDAGLRRALGEAGRRRVLERYDLGRNTERLAEIFERRLVGVWTEGRAAESARRRAAGAPRREGIEGA